MTSATAATSAGSDIATIAERFVELCNQGKNFDVMRTLYAPGIVSVEVDGSETAGQQAVIQKSERFGESNTIERQVLRGPFFNNVRDGNGQFAIHFVFEVTNKATGKRGPIEEVAIYTVANGLITREQFFAAGSR